MLDPIRARAEADAAERREAGTLWGAGPVAWEGVTAGTVAQPEVVPTVERAPGEAAQVRPRVAALRRAEAQPAEPSRGMQEVPTALLAAILARLELAPPAASGVPGWLVEAVGNPLTYDAATPSRKDVCARVDPALYRRLQEAKTRFGLRTTAGAWEYVLRAGLAVAERGVGRESRQHQRDGGTSPTGRCSAVGRLAALPERAGPPRAAPQAPVTPDACKI
jgi:hypothetical protein